MQRQIHSIVYAASISSQRWIGSPTFIRWTKSKQISSSNVKTKNDYLGLQRGRWHFIEPHHEEVEDDGLPDGVSTINVPLGNNAMEDVSVIGDTDFPSPPEPFGHLVIVASLLAIVGCGCAVCAGKFASFQDFDESGYLAARAFVCVSIGAFMISIIMVFCASLAYQNSRGSEGFPVLMIYAWTMFGIGTANGVLMLIESTKMESFSETKWVYISTLSYILPFTMMMVHAEFARKYNNERQGAPLPIRLLSFW